MNIWGTMICRNEGKKAITTLSYHLNYLKFSGFVFLDNGSTDETRELIEHRDNRIVYFSTEDMAAPTERGMLQSLWKNRATRWIWANTDADIVLPVDCDTFWVGTDKLESEFTEDRIGMLCANYAFLPYKVPTSSECLKDYYSSFWKVLRYRQEKSHTTKVALHKSVVNFGNLVISEGDHFLIDTMKNCGMVILPTSRASVYEYPVLTYEDLVRKTVNTGIGRILAHGKDWVDCKSPIATYTAIDLDRLSRFGEIQDRWNGFLLTNEEVGNLKKNEQNLVEDTTLVDVDFLLI